VDNLKEVAPIIPASTTTKIKPQIKIENQMNLSSEKAA
jgi:hypothetical protein